MRAASSGCVGALIIPEEGCCSGGDAFSGELIVGGISACVGASSTGVSTIGGVSTTGSVDRVTGSGGCPTSFSLGVNEGSTTSSLGGNEGSTTSSLDGCRGFSIESG